MARITEELEHELTNLPEHFYGRVEISYQNGKPGLVNITATKKLSVGTPLGAANDFSNTRSK